ncbi:hypothetical protein KSP40_PGU009362 [Platanthera guangdongensis]|uniref:Uncharacterized protein n=1 Tax=Platanthera guangdongensis TaxID=2320717 RepID=A0ABR2LQE7_9ASPA
MEDSFVPQSSPGIMVEQEEDELGSFSSFEEEDDEDPAESISSSSSDSVEDAGGDASLSNGRFDMSNLIAQLPLKRGLSKHFHGKSRSFASLCDVRSLEDLVKIERPCGKKMKSSRSYGGGLDSQKALSFSRTIKKKTRRSSFSNLGTKKQGFVGGSRPPIPPQRSPGKLSNLALLFAR